MPDSRAKTSRSPLEFHAVSLEENPARALVVAMREEIAELYTGVVLDGPEMPKAGPRELGPPGGVFLVGFDEDGRAVCGGGVKDLGSGACEIKRMYVVPEARRQGVGRALLAALEDQARLMGFMSVRLDCERHNWPLYRAAGYVEIDDYNDNPFADHWAEKHLVVTPID